MFYEFPPPATPKKYFNPFIGMVRRLDGLQVTGKLGVAKEKRFQLHSIHDLCVQRERFGGVGEVAAVDHVLENLDTCH